MAKRVNDAILADCKGKGNNLFSCEFGLGSGKTRTIDGIKRIITHNIGTQIFDIPNEVVLYDEVTGFKCTISDENRMECWKRS